MGVKKYGGNLGSGNFGSVYNEQSLRTVEMLEHMYPQYDRLNLSKEVLDGLLKHRTPFDRPKWSSSSRTRAQVVDLVRDRVYEP